MYSILDFYSMHKRENSKEKRWKRKKRIKRKASPSARNPFIFLCTDTHRYRKKRKTKKKKKILKHGNRWNFTRNPTGRKKKKGTRCLASSQFHFPPSEYPVDWIYKRNDISNIKIDDGWIFTIVTRGQDERERETTLPSVEIWGEKFGVSPPSLRLITRGWKTANPGPFCSNFENATAKPPRVSSSWFRSFENTEAQRILFYFPPWSRN